MCTVLVWSNPKNSDEWATIEQGEVLVRLTYKSKYGGIYEDLTKTVKGAKASFSLYCGFKSEWIEVSK